MIKTSRIVKAFRFLAFLFAFILYLLLLHSCKKGRTTAEEHPGTDSPVTPPSNPGAPPAGSCSAVKSSAETIAIFPIDNPWRKDISAAAVDAYNSAIIAGFSANVIKADFGSGLWEGAPIGIPYTVVCGSQAKYTVTFRENDYDGNYGDESDAGPYAIPLSTPIEGNGEGDRHVISVDTENGVLYELYNASLNNNRWEASSGAIFHFNSNTLRTNGWTSADAAGLPIFPGLVRYEEILRGEIDHPIRFTLASSRVTPAHISPATHHVNSSGATNASLPFGALIRLKAGFDISGYSPTNQVILKAMKKYGLILADIGSSLYISGAPDDRWNNDDLRHLGQVHGSDFEVVKFN